LGRRLGLFLGLGTLCYAGLIFFGEGGKFWEAFRAFPSSYLPLLLSLAFTNYLLRFARWQIYLDALGISIGYRKSFQIFMAGLAMTVTPGKVGEAVKAYFLKREGEDRWSEGLSVVFAERLTDLMGVVILVAMGLSVLPVGRVSVLLGGGVCLFLVLVLVRPVLFRRMVRYLSKVPAMRRPSEKLSEMYESIRRLMVPRMMLLALLISCLAWFAECLVLHFSLVAIRSELGGLQATFVYALSTLAGALSILPGGLVVTEGSMAGLLLLSGLERSQAVSVTFIVRLCTLWFAVFLGMAAFLVLEKSSRMKAAISIPGARVRSGGEVKTE
jgi:uncharacterized protein (TIRG00374 family)